MIAAVSVERDERDERDFPPANGQVTAERGETLKKSHMAKFLCCYLHRFVGRKVIRYVRDQMPVQLSVVLH